MPDDLGHIYDIFETSENLEVIYRQRALNNLQTDLRILHVMYFVAVVSFWALYFRTCFANLENVAAQFVGVCISLIFTYVCHRVRRHVQNGVNLLIVESVLEE